MTKPPPANGKIPSDFAKLDGAASEGKDNSGTTRTLRCRTVAQGRLQPLNYVRDLPTQAAMSGQPENLSTETLAPDASEALLAALGSSLALGIHANALAQGIPIRGLELDIEGDINTSADRSTGRLNPKPPGFETVRVTVHLDGDAPRERLDALVKQATIWSPVANTLHNPVHLDVTLEPARKPPVLLNKVTAL